MSDKNVNVTLESLKKVHKENAEAVFQDIAQLGGFGAIEPDYAGGLDIGGLPDGDAKKTILELVSGKSGEKPSAEQPKKEGAK